MFDFTGTKRIPEESYRSYLHAAWFVDAVFCWLPGAGDFFIMYCRGMYQINRYSTNNMETTTVMNLIGEWIPFMPSCTLFVWTSYKINLKNTAGGLTGDTLRATSSRVIGNREGGSKGTTKQEGLEEKQSSVYRDTGGSRPTDAPRPASTVSFQNRPAFDGIQNNQRTDYRDDNRPAPIHPRNPDDQSTGYQEAV